MPKFKIIIDGEKQNDEFTTREAAEEHANYLCACAREGDETLFMSNPGDNPFDEDTYENPEYEIVEVDD